MNNLEFLKTLKDSFKIYLNTGPRSNQKLKILHGAISRDLTQRLGDEQYKVYSLGFEAGREKKLNGRYVEKAVDITICKDDEQISGIAVKFVMSNYSQNSNNYFENMLGETANIRCNRIPYFQILIIPDKMPYYDNSGEIKKWERITSHNLDKYIKLSNDNIDVFLHTPNKTLVFIIHISDENTASITNKREYKDFYLNNDFEITKSDIEFEFGNTIVYNDYDEFIQKVAYAIKSI